MPVWLDGGGVMQGCFNPLPPFLQGSPEFLGQAFAVPQVELVDEPYCKPALQFFNFYKGTKTAGELIATFELIELDYSGYLEVMGLEEATSSFQLKRGCRGRAHRHRSGGEGEVVWCGREVIFIAQRDLALSVQPSVPEDVEPKEPSYLGDPQAGRFLIPEGICPVLKEFCIEVCCLLLGWLL